MNINNIFTKITFFISYLNDFTFSIAYFIIINSLVFFVILSLFYKFLPPFFKFNILKFLLTLLQSVISLYLYILKSTVFTNFIQSVTDLFLYFIYIYIWFYIYFFIFIFYNYILLHLYDFIIILICNSL